MPTFPVTRFEDGIQFADGLAGDVLLGAPVSDMRLRPALVWVTADFNEPRDNALGIHASHDYAPMPLGPRDLLITPRRGGRPEWVGTWNRISGPGGSYGNVVKLRHDDRESTLYGHMEWFSDRIAEWLRAGAPRETAPYIEAGEAIGKMGNTGNVWPTPTPGDLESGKHLHYEHRTRPDLGEVLIDPASRMIFEDQTTMGPIQSDEYHEVNPEPNEPLDLRLTAALDEAHLLHFLIQSMIDFPLPGGLEEALSAIERESLEIVAAHGTQAGDTLDEARLMAQSARVLIEALPGAPMDYTSTLEAYRNEAAELAQAISRHVP